MSINQSKSIGLLHFSRQGMNFCLKLCFWTESMFFHTKIHWNLFKDLLIYSFKVRKLVSSIHLFSQQTAVRVTSEPGKSQEPETPWGLLTWVAENRISGPSFAAFQDCKETVGTATVIPLNPMIAMQAQENSQVGLECIFKKIDNVPMNIPLFKKYFIYHFCIKQHKQSSDHDLVPNLGSLKPFKWK